MTATLCNILDLPRDITQIRWVLGDQLDASHSWFETIDPSIAYVIAELRQETDYAPHHVQKICAFFAAMRSFADARAAEGHVVLYLDLDTTAGFDSLPQLITELIQRNAISHFAYQRPDELRLLEQLAALRPPAGCTLQRVESEHFLLPFDEIPTFFKPDKAVRMENFYRKMRKRHQVLMEGDQPRGDRWNFDAENRKKLKKADIESLPAPLVFSNEVSAILERLQRHGVRTIGEAAEHLVWPINREQALQQLRFFCEVCLPRFGSFQDAMTSQSPHRWSLYHARVSFALNVKILSPNEVINAAVKALDDRPAEIDMAQVEGFVRQILGWREYMRGMYWANMPGYEKSNALEARNKLPGFFWTGETSMRCMREAIGQSLEYSYAHHIQRLMITGNFCLIAGIDPAEVDEWYLSIYIDAIEWVEMPNTRGMSQFADGGLIASKPYAASGNYVSKMSDYCSHCQYDVKRKTGHGACPMNSLYWRFMIQHRDRLAKNPRIAMLFRGWDKQSDAERKAILDYAETQLAALETL